MDALIEKIVDGAVQPFLTLLMALAVMFFLWGLIEFIYGAENEEKRKTGRQHMIWGLIGLFVMFSVNGIIQLIKNFIGSLNS